ncbi:glycosyltransferase family 2 protein [candidate division CSSED10-310 bacterium]|uniref:Glycosyltransferase family 2 protein n=1 Tax=candidate division CSSED10-310 bacterium TaxID=2855610 RepID=A0ABV6YX45_UNCC1
MSENLSNKENKDISLSLVIPVYKAAQIIPVLCERLNSTLATITDKYEIILIDDRSPDDSWPVLLEMTEKYDHLTAVRLSRNFGQHYAISAGLDLSHGEWVVVMDCDLQDQPEDIPRLLEEARSGHDIVYVRRMNCKHNTIKQFFSRLFYKIFAILSGMRIENSVGTFRIMSRAVVDALCSMKETYRLFGGMVEWVGFNTAVIDLEHGHRFSGRSSYTMKRLFKLAFDGTISFSNRPLYFSVTIGAVISFLSALYGSYLLFYYFFIGVFGVYGWLSIMTLISFLGGLILLNLGVIGIYIGRIYDQTKGRPIYIIDRIIISPTERTK